MRAMDTMRNTIGIGILAVIVLGVLPVVANASGSGGLGGGRSFGGSLDSPRQTDPAYEQGKAVFKGRIKEYGEVKYCLISTEAENGVAKIKRKSLKPFKGQTAQVLADALRFCDDNSTVPNKVLTRDDFLYLIYYLNKRYRLKLT